MNRTMRSSRARDAFSEAMDAGTLNGKTLSLHRKGAATGVTAKVGYNVPKRRVVLNPADSLKPGMTYVATVRGRSGRAADLAGNPLPGAETWTFTVRR